METESSWASHGGVLSVHTHDSVVCDCSMRFGVYAPPQAKNQQVPVLWYLSGLTCSWANVMEKSGIQAAAAKYGIMIVAPDTSPRGEAVADDEAYDLGQGAGFYLTATQSPWSSHFKMDKYITEELQALIGKEFPANMASQGITGHSMGGHGAITLHLKHPELYKSVSAFSPITSPSLVPWGEKVFTAYLGDDKSTWQQYDASELVKKQASGANILIDTGTGDQFLTEQLKPELFVEVCEQNKQALHSRMQPDYDHSYYFIASFIADHLEHHAAILHS